MSVLDRLSAATGVYWGEGEGPGGSRFVARVTLQRHADGSLTLDYEAWSAQAGLQHAESARMARTGETVTLAATSNGSDDTMLFREGEPGVFGSIGPQRVGLVISTQEQKLTFSWWWTGRDGELREQSRAVVSPMRQIIAPPTVPGFGPITPDDDEPAVDTADETAADTVDDPADDQADDEADDDAVDDDAMDAALPEPGTVPWPGILVLHGASTGLVAQRLAARLTRAAVVRTDLFDRAVRGTAGRPDPALRQRIALSVVQGYAATGHPVILHGASSRVEHEELVAALVGSGLSPVKLVEVADGEDYGEVARRLIDND